VPSGFTFEFPGYLDVDSRGVGYYAFYTSVKNFGSATWYLSLASVCPETG
jgi:hypothetical protein